MKHKTIGRVTLFVHDKEGKFNEPDYRGYLETSKGKYTVSLWKEDRNTKAGYILKGQVTEVSDE